MILQRHGRKRLLLSYEMNVHPGDTLRELLHSLDRWTLPIRDRVAPGQAFGIVPRVGRKLLQELRTQKARRTLQEKLATKNFFLYTVNAFPIGNFHARRVKEQVYSPPWTHGERARLTNQVVDLLAELLPQDEVGTISTLGGTYRPWGNTRQDHERMAVNYLRTVEHMARMALKGGPTVLLAVEPEPDTTLETMRDVIHLVDNFLRPLIPQRLARPLGVSRSRAEELFHCHFTVNLDVCHLSVLFRDPVREWRALEKAGLKVGKLHITNALALPRPGRSPTALAELKSYDEPRYLHQFAARRPGGELVRGGDLSELCPSVVADTEEVRVHFHVPLSRARMGRLSTTRSSTSQVLHHTLRHPHPPHLAIETYTWPIISRDKDNLVDGIVREFRWVLREMNGKREGA